jgi:hypothetical protein
MATDPNEVTESIPRRSWQRLAELANRNDGTDLSGDAFRGAYILAVQEFRRMPDRRTRPVYGQARQEGGCWEFDPVEITALGGVSVGVGGRVCIGDDWSASLTAHLRVAGSRVWTWPFTLTPEQPRVAFRPNAVIARARVEVCLDDVVTLTARGETAYWWGSWDDEPFEASLYCFGPGGPRRLEAA